MSLGFCGCGVAATPDPLCYMCNCLSCHMGVMGPWCQVMHDNGDQGDEKQPCHDLDVPEASRRITVTVAYAQTGHREMPSVVDVAVRFATQGRHNLLA